LKVTAVEVLHWQVNKWSEPKISAEQGAFMLILEPGECIFDVSIGKYDARITRRNQMCITSKIIVAYGDVIT
jgi:hypothetical protein